MGLFDGGFDMDALAQMLNPIGTANAQPSNMSIQPGTADPLPLAPNGAPQTGLTPDALANSLAGKPALGPMPSVIPPQGQPYNPQNGEAIAPPPTNGLPVPPPPNNITRLGGGPPAGDTALPGAPPVPVVPPLIVPPVPSINTNPLAKPLVDDTTTQGLVGAALTGNAPAAAGPTDVSARAKTANDTEKANTLASVLRGIKAPAPPVVQKIGTPAAPKPTGQIKLGELAALWACLMRVYRTCSGRCRRR